MSTSPLPETGQQPRTIDASLSDLLARASVLAEALPFIRKFNGSVVVVKVGGAAIAAGNADDILRDIVLLRFVGMKPVIVHGGGSEISAWQQRIGIEPRFVDGLRVTDEQTIELVQMVLTGKIGPDLVSRLNRLGAAAIGLSGEDGPTLLVRRRRGPQGEDLGYVGDVEQVNIDPINALLDLGSIPVLASMGLGFDGHSYNVNADSVAAEVAAALSARKLILVSDVDGVHDETGALLPEIDIAQTRQLINDGVATAGMIPKLEAASRAAMAGCDVHIIDGGLKHALLLELLTDSGVGTMVRVQRDEPHGVDQW